MEYQVITTEQFYKDIKYYKRKKKYQHIDEDIDEIIKQLEKGNFLGNEVPDLKISDSEVVYKVRAINSDTHVGKSNGYRLIYYVIKNEYEIYLLTIYYKKEKENINSQEIIELIKVNCS